MTYAWLALANLGCSRTELPDWSTETGVPAPRGEEGAEDDACAANSGVSTLFSGPGTPNAVAAYAGHVYFADWAFGGSLSVMARDGSGLRVLATDQPAVTDIAVDEGGVVWATTGLTTPGGRLLSLDTLGRTRVLLEKLNQPGGLAMDPQRVCLAEGSNSGSGNIAAVRIGRVLCVERSSGRVETLAEGFTVVTDVALDETHVYFTDPFGGVVARAPLRGGAVETLATGIGAAHVAVRAGQVYVGAGSGLYVLPNSGGTPALLAELDLQVFSFAAAADALYLTSRSRSGAGEGKLYRVRETGVVDVLASNQLALKGLALDSTHVYWAGGDAPPAYVRAQCKNAVP